MAKMLRFWSRFACAILCIALAITFLGQSTGHNHTAKAQDGIAQSVMVLTQMHSGADGCLGQFHSKGGTSDCAEHCFALPLIGASGGGAENLDIVPRTIATALHAARVPLPDKPPRMVRQPA